MKRTVTTLVLAAILAGTSHAAINGKKPDFMDKQQLASMRAQAASNSIKETEDPAFYTGKPYLNSSDGYAFKYRSYIPKIARWTSEDPSGFPDGANGNFYAPTPTCQIDPYGLDTVTVTGTPDSDTTSGGNFNISIREAAHQVATSIQGRFIVDWVVDSSVSGWVVQNVNVDYSNIYNDSDGSSYTLPFSVTPNYWEAWRVDFGVFSRSGDIFQTTNFPGSTYGTATITGKVDFYRDSVFSSTNDPSTWSTSDVLEANGLHATTTQPSWWTGSGFNHNLTVVWE